MVLPKDIIWILKKAYQSVLNLLTVFTNKYWTVKGSGQFTEISVYPDHDALCIVDLPYIFLNTQMTNLNKITFFSMWNRTFLLFKHDLKQTIYLWTSICLLVEGDIHLFCLQHKVLDIKEYNKSKSPLG